MALHTRALKNTDTEQTQTDGKGRGGDGGDGGGRAGLVSAPQIRHKTEKVLM